MKTWKVVAAIILLVAASWGVYEGVRAVRGLLADLGIVTAERDTAVTQRDEHRRRLRELEGQVAGLEATNRELERSNGRLEGDLGRIAAAGRAGAEILGRITVTGLESEDDVDDALAILDGLERAVRQALAVLP